MNTKEIAINVAWVKEIAVRALDDEQKARIVITSNARAASTYVVPGLSKEETRALLYDALRSLDDDDDDMKLTRRDN